MDNSKLHLDQIRTDYQLASLSIEEVGEAPLPFLEKWLLEVEHSQITEVNAMTVCTADKEGRPHARMALLKGLEPDGLVFFTNYNSRKGLDLSENNQIALLFFWKELERQVRVEGIAEKIDATASDEYFHSRPRASQIGAIASPQSEEIADRNVIEEQVKNLEAQYENQIIPRPDNWGGYRVKPIRMEFWQGRASRLHDRIVFEREHLNTSAWRKFRLAP